MPSIVELKYRCTHCGKKNLYKTKRKDKKQRHCAWCDRDFDVIPVAKTIREIDEIDEVSTVGKQPPEASLFKNKQRIDFVVTKYNDSFFSERIK